MKPKQPKVENTSKKVRKSLLVEAEKLSKARKMLGVANDAEVLRLALDHLLSHFANRNQGTLSRCEEEE